MEGKDVIYTKYKCSKYKIKSQKAEVIHLISIRDANYISGMQKREQVLHFWSIFVSIPEGARRGSDFYCPIRKTCELAPKNETGMFSSSKAWRP